MAEKHDGPVAVVDDDPAVLDSLKVMLESAGFPTKLYASAEAFLDDPEGRSSCLILDHHLPRMTGLDLVERLRKEGNTIPLLLITGAPSPAILARASTLGVEKVLEKPADEEELLNYVSTHT